MKFRILPNRFSVFFLMYILLSWKAPVNAQILAWQLNGAAGNEAYINATINDPNLQISALQRGSGLNPSALANAFSSTNYSASGDKANAISNSRFVYFTVQAKPGYTVALTTLNARFRRSSTGPNTFRWQYSTDGIGFTDLGPGDIVYTGTENIGADRTAVDLSTELSLQNVTSTTTITFRLLGWGASATSGTFAIGRYEAGNASASLSISGTITAVISPPNATAATAISHNAFNANWDPVTSATGYHLDVSTSPTFSSLQSQTITEGFNGGTTPPAGWTFTSIGGTYTTSGNFGVSSPSLQMDATNDRIITPQFNGTASQLSFWIKGQGTNAASALLVEGFDGSNWITIDNITNSIPTTGTVKTYNGSSSPSLPVNLNRFRFTYSKNAGNLAFDDVSVTYSDVVPSFLPGYHGLAVAGTFSVVSGLSLCQNGYYYRVRAVGATSTSDNSNVITVGQLSIHQYRSVASGQWSDPATWEQFDGTAWVPATTFPNVASGICPGDTALIRNGHHVTLTGSYNFPDVMVETGSELTLSNSSQLTVSETFVVYGTLRMENNALLDGAGDFSLASGAHLFSGSPQGIAASGNSGNIQLGGSRTFASGASYTYKGNGNQVTGSGLTQNTPLHVVFDSPGNTVTLTSPLTVTGNISILATSLDSDNHNITVGGNWTNTGQFIHGTSTVEFNSSSTGTIWASSFFHIIFSGTGIKEAAGNLIISGNLTISNNFNAGGNFHILQGDWINNGVFTANTSTIRFSNTAADQTISGAAIALNNTFYGLELAKATEARVLEVIAPIGLTATASNSLIISSGTLKLSHPSTIYPFNNGNQATIPSSGGFWNNGGTITAGNFSWNVAGLFKNSAGTTNIGTSSGNSLRYFTGSEILIEGGDVNIAARISKDQNYSGTAA